MKITRNIPTTIEVMSRSKKRCSVSCKFCDDTTGDYDWCTLYDHRVGGTNGRKRCRECINDFGIKKNV